LGSVVLPTGDVATYGGLGVGAGGFREGAFSFSDSFGWCAWAKFIVFAGKTYNASDYSVTAVNGGYNMQFYPRFNPALYFFGGLDVHAYSGGVDLGLLPSLDFGAGYNFTENLAVEGRFTFSGLEASLKWRF
jgi:hypothetical protein